MTNLFVEKAIEIEKSPSEVWDALVNPDKIKVYLFGTEVKSEWEEGKGIIFQGEYEGQVYHDKGIIQEIKSPEILKYMYWSSFSGLDDRLDNYQMITFKIIPSVKGVTLYLKQENIPHASALEHTSQNWEIIMAEIKRLVETDFAN